MRYPCCAKYGLLRTVRRPLVYAPIVLAPQLEFGAGTILQCQPPRIRSCADEPNQYILEQELTVCVPFRWGVRTDALAPVIECCP